MGKDTIYRVYKLRLELPRGREGLHTATFLPLVYKMWFLSFNGKVKMKS